RTAWGERAQSVSFTPGFKPGGKALQFSETVFYGSTAKARKTVGQAGLLAPRLTSIAWSEPRLSDSLEWPQFLLCASLRASAPPRLLLSRYLFTAEAQRNAEIRREDSSQ